MMQIEHRSISTLLDSRVTAFLAVAETGSVHAAARALGLVQTAMTRRIQSLEYDLNTSLFVRSRKGMTLTTAGRALLLRAQRLRELEAESLAAVRGDAPAVETLRIAAPSSLLASRLAGLLTGLAVRMPNLSIQVRVHDADNVLELVRRNEVDVAVCEAAEVGPEFSSKLLKAERYVAVTCTAWRRRPFAEVVKHERIVDFDPRDTLTLRFLQRAKLLDGCRRDRHFVSNTHALAAFVEVGAGYTVLAEAFLAPFVATGSLVRAAAPHCVEVRMALAWYERKFPTLAFGAVIAGLK
jgi:LysR family transcriptional regulator, chromosome initiation inhibitor